LCKIFLNWNETEVAIVFSLFKKTQGGTWLCQSAIDWITVVCYWWISCEWQRLLLSHPHTSKHLIREEKMRIICNIL